MTGRVLWLATALAALLLVALALWIRDSIEWVDFPVPTPAKGEAARDRYYAAKQLARRVGATVTTVHSFEQLPPAGATLVLASPRWSMFPGRDEALQRWIREGGHVVAMQSAWSTEGAPPAWVPIRSSRPKQAENAASAPSASPAASEAISALAELVAPPCDLFSEPVGGAGAFGAPRTYRVCGRPARILRVRAPSWQLIGDAGVVAARVGHGQGDITSNAIEGSFDNAAVVREDGALAFAAMLQLRPGDRVWFFVGESRAPLMTLLWEHGAPALVLALVALALALWRSSVRFGPRVVDAPVARRSIGEQVRRTAAFIARGDGLALYAASVRALEDEARRSIPSYAGLLARQERSDAIARRTGTDPVALAAAMAAPARPDRKSIAATIARLEKARRALHDPGRRRRPQRPIPPDASPP